MTLNQKLTRRTILKAGAGAGAFFIASPSVVRAAQPKNQRNSSFVPGAALGLKP